MDIDFQTYLLTLWYHENHGTALQAYALQRAFERIGVNAIHLVCSSFSKAFQPLPYASIRELCRTSTKKHPILDFYDREIRHSDLIYTRRSLGRMSNVKAKVVLGSDQVWNPSVLGYESIFTMALFPGTIRKFTYAPSVGTYMLSNEFKDRLKIVLRNFELLSCRDPWLPSKLGQKLKREMTVVVDPTLLFNRTFWANEAKDIPRFGGRYVLLYKLGTRKDVVAYANRLAEKRCATVFDLMEKAEIIGPHEFIGLVKNANFVVTDSFHGLIFSHIFKRPVKAFYKYSGGLLASDNVRLRDLRELLGHPKVLRGRIRLSWAYLRKVVGYDG